MKLKNKKIVNLNTPIPVYDIEVPVVHNFALDSSIIAHNSDGSKDVLDAVCASIWTCSRYIEQSAGSERLKGLEDSLRTLTKNSGNSFNRFASILGANNVKRY